MSELKNLKIPPQTKWKLQTFKVAKRCATYGEAIEKLLKDSKELDTIKQEKKS